MSEYRAENYTSYKIAFEPWGSRYSDDWYLYGWVKGEKGVVFRKRGYWKYIGSFKDEQQAKDQMEKIVTLENPKVTYYDKDGRNRETQYV